MGSGRSSFGVRSSRFCSVFIVHDYHSNIERPDRVRFLLKIQFPSSNKPSKVGGARFYGRGRSRRPRGRIRWAEGNGQRLSASRVTRRRRSWKGRRQSFAPRLISIGNWMPHAFGRPEKSRAAGSQGLTRRRKWPFLGTDVPRLHGSVTTVGFPDYAPPIPCPSFSDFRVCDRRDFVGDRSQGASASRGGLSVGKLFRRPRAAAVARPGE